MFVDSHCHLEMEEYDKDRGAVIERAARDGITSMVTVGTEPRYFPRVVEIIEAHPALYGAIGIHPHNASDYSPDVENTIKDYLKHPRIVAYGEIGLDFFRNYAPRDVQIRAFKRQIEVGREAGLPLVIHSRDARDETLAILKDMRLHEHPTVIHCYSYDLDTAKELLDMGMYLSVPGTVTYKNSGLPQIVRHAPLDHLLSETDAEVVIRFSVKDTGIGIPAEKQEHLFQKFTQADASITRKYGGTGLGLAISKELVERMGGEIGVNSEEGRGSEYWFTVRLGKQADRERGFEPPADIRGVHVLVVDDNATNRQVLSGQLRAWGIRPEEVPDGPTALQALHQAVNAGDPFRMAILDMQMPDMDGATLGRAIKDDGTLRNTQLVLMTSIGRRGDAREMEQIGFSAYLTKPARQSELFDCLAIALAEKAAARPSQPIITRHRVRELRRGVVRILLAEDNITNQQVAIAMLKRMGLRADAVANGAEAVKALETIPYDLVLMDVQMPVMDGIEATQRIRDPRSAVLNHRIPIIAMTAHALHGDREKFMNAGMDDYVPKPVSSQALADALDRWLPKDSAARKEPSSGAPATPVVPERVAGKDRPGAPVFDIPAMMDRLGGDQDLARELIWGFLEDLPKQISALRGYLEAGDAPNAVRQAHTVKGASANMGGEALSAVALEMETAAKNGRLESAAARQSELEAQFIRLKEAMNDYLKGL